MTDLEIPLDILEDEDWEVPEDEDAAAERDSADLAFVTRQARRLLVIQRRRAELARIAEAEIDRLQQRAAAIDAPLRRRADYLEGCLRAFALRERELGRGKTLNLLYATVKTRETGGGWTANGGDLLAWAETNRPELVQTVRQVLVTDAKRVLRATEVGVVDPKTGDLVPGITVAPKTVTATVSVELEEQ